jgi:serine/threonine protein kinase
LASERAAKPRKKMKPERWQKIEQIYNSALELDADRREVFLEQACAGDESIRKEVQKLLELNTDAEKFIESPAIEKLAHEMAEDSEVAKESSSIIGKSNSRYEIVEELGRGGMGEVYRAKDRKLGRDVAIKVLPKEFALDNDRIARFRREAKLLASLNHSNIAALYELEESGETHFLVLELIEGETLADRLKQGPIQVEESLKLALQIAEALEAAHEKGVIHRDLKPANIKITTDGNVKVLDFGLAKTFLKDQESLNLTDSPTLGSTLTQKGFILGTASYMSPEQAQGQTVDKRADIWAFGCILYEMLTGIPAFPGKTVTEILAAIIRAEPDWSILPANLHWRLLEVLESCLKKGTKDRYHDISDVRVDIQKVLADSSGPLAKPASAESQIISKMAILWIFAAIIFTAIISVVVGWNLKQTEPLHAIRFDHNLPEDQHFNINTGGTLAVSHDGSQFAFITNEGLYLRSMKDMNVRLLLGTNEKPQTPFFSVDGQWLGYWSESDKKLKKIPIYGGTPIDLCDVDMMIWGASWYADDTILYAEIPKGIMRISANGGTPESLVEGPYAFPQLLPDGKSIIYTDVTTKPSYKIIAQSIESGKKEVLLTAGWAKYLTSGHLVYISDNNLFAVPFNPDTFDFIGGEVLIDENI